MRGERDGEGEKEALAVMTKKNYGLQINFENLNQKYFNLKSAYQKLEVSHLVLLPLLLFSMISFIVKKLHRNSITLKVYSLNK